jgi:hypothetical protein
LYHPDYAGIDIDIASPTLEAKGTIAPAIPAIVDYLTSAPHKVILVDNTSANTLAEAYPTFLRRGISIVTPKKKAFSGSYELSILPSRRVRSCIMSLPLELVCLSSPRYTISSRLET